MIINALFPGGPNSFARNMQNIDRSDLDVFSQEDRDSIVFKPNFDIQTNWQSIFKGFDIKVKGVVTFAEDNRSVKTISQNGYFFVKERRWLSIRKLEIVPGAQGEPEYSFYFRGKKLPFDERAQAWLEKVLPEVFKLTGINVWPKIHVFLAEKNLDGALKEIANIKMNSAKQTYYETVLKSVKLDPEQMSQFVEEVSQNISSSWHLKEMLNKIIQNFPNNIELTKDLISASEKISSSRNRGEILSSITEKRILDSNSAMKMAKTIKTISSDHEKMKSLINMAKICPISDEVIDTYLESATSINSSSNRADVLQTLFERKNLTRENWIKILSTVSTIHSNSKRSQVLQYAVPYLPAGEEVFNSYLSATKGINSSGEKANAMISLVEYGSLPPSTVSEIALASETISSNSERAKVLKKMINLLPPEKFVISTYLDATFSLSSSNTKTSILKELLEKNDLPKESLKEIVKRTNLTIQSSKLREEIVDLVTRKM
jgi:hypothetical protein